MTLMGLIEGFNPYGNGRDIRTVIQRLRNIKLRL